MSKIIKDYKEIYNGEYSKFNPEWFSANNLSIQKTYLEENSDSIKNFLESLPDHLYLNLKNKNILVCGSGLGPVCLLLEGRGAFVTGIDISSLAVSGAKEIAENLGKNISYFVDDISSTENNYGKFDYIFDGHLFHCLTSSDDRCSYLQFVNDHLKDNGLFISEIMVGDKNFRTPVGYSYDESNILYSETSQGDLAIRYIADSHELEKELRSVETLSIKYFYYHDELSFNIFKEYKDHPHQNSPKTVRALLSKNL